LVLGRGSNGRLSRWVGVLGLGASADASGWGWGVGGLGAHVACGDRG